MKIEPEWYAPPIPLILVNGTDGIGTGWSTKIPCHNPEDVIACVRACMEESDGAMEGALPPIKPWYKGFTGEIKEKDISGGKVYGSYGIVAFGKRKNTLEITELPVGIWTDDYKEWLENQCSDSKKSGIKSYKNNSTESTVHFTVTIQPDSRSKVVTAYKSNDLVALKEYLKLTSQLSYKNMHAFGIDGAIHRYEHPHDIIREFV
jgi:DNA topoisomerase-2